MMATKRVLKDVATVFVPLGEDSSRSMKYATYLFTNVFCRAEAGSHRQSIGEIPNDSVTLYVFDRGSKVHRGDESLNVAAACEGIFRVIRDSAPQNDDGQPCYIVPYDASTLEKPPAKSRKIISANRRKAGTLRMWHWEVHASK